MENSFDTPDSMFEYELFSVINHEGQTISNGHYTNFCRYQDDVSTFLFLFALPLESDSDSVFGSPFACSFIVSTMRKFEEFLSRLY